MLAANEAVDGGSGWGTSCFFRERWIRGGFWDIRNWGGNESQVAEDGGALEPRGWRGWLLYIPGVCHLDRAGPRRFIGWRRCLDGVYSENLDRSQHLRRFHFEKSLPQVDFSPLTQRSENLRVSRLGVNPTWQSRGMLESLC